MKINWKMKSCWLLKRPLLWNKSSKKCKNNWKKKKKTIIKTNKILSHQIRRSPPSRTRLKRIKTKLNYKNQKAKKHPMSCRKSRRITNHWEQSMTPRSRSSLKTKIHSSLLSKWSFTKKNGLTRPVMMIESILLLKWHHPPKIGFLHQLRRPQLALKMMSEI